MPEITLEEMIRELREAGINRLILELPEGETIFRAEGSNVSGPDEDATKNFRFIIKSLDSKLDEDIKRDEEALAAKKALREQRDQIRALKARVAEEEALAAEGKG